MSTLGVKLLNLEARLDNAREHKKLLLEQLEGDIVLFGVKDVDIEKTKAEFMKWTEREYDILLDIALLKQHL